MSKVYAKLKDAVKFSRKYVDPGKYSVSFVASEKGIKDQERGLYYNALVKIEGHEEGFWDRFLVPRSEEEQEAFLNRKSRKGNTFVDPDYAKFQHVQRASGLSASTTNEVLDMFNKASLKWPVYIEVTAKSDDSKMERWGELKEYVTANCPKATFNEGEGVTYIKWRVYTSPLTTQEEEVLTTLDGWPGVYVHNVLKSNLK